MVQVEAGDSKLLLFETFLLFLIILFFLLSRTSYRGARAPKNEFDSNFSCIVNHPVETAAVCIVLLMTVLVYTDKQII